MFATLPNSNYFRTLQIDQDMDLSFSGEVLQANDDKVDFTRTSRQREDEACVEDKTFYVSLEEIGKNCRKLAELIIKGPLDVPASDFEALLRYLCPSSSGLFRDALGEENLLPILLISHKLGLEQIALQCQTFLCANQIKSLLVVQLMTAFDCVNEEHLHTRSCLLKAILEHSDLFSVLLNQLDTAEPLHCVPLLRKAVKSLNALEHNATFVNSSAPLHCQCSKEDSKKKRLFQRKATRNVGVSFCGLLCEDCELACCTKCWKRLCPAKLGEFLLDYKSEQEEILESESEEILYTAEASETEELEPENKYWEEPEEENAWIPKPATYEKSHGVEHYPPVYVQPKQDQHNKIMQDRPLLAEESYYSPAGQFKVTPAAPGPYSVPPPAFPPQYTCQVQSHRYQPATQPVQQFPIAQYQPYSPYVSPQQSYIAPPAYIQPQDCHIFPQSGYALIPQYQEPPQAAVQQPFVHFPSCQTFHPVIYM